MALRAGLRQGLSLSEFWAMTPWMLGVWLDERFNATEASLKHIVTGAWFGAAWSRAQRMPSLHDALEQISRPKPREPIPVADLMAKTRAAFESAKVPQGA